MTITITLTDAEAELITTCLNSRASAVIGRAGMQSNARRRESLKAVAKFDDLADRISDHPKDDLGGTIDDQGAAAADRFGWSPEHGF